MTQANDVTKQFDVIKFVIYVTNASCIMVSVIGIMDFMKCVLIIFTAIFVVEVTPTARNDENDVYINQKTRKLIVKTLMRMNEGYDKEPLQAVDFRCRNRATQTLLSQFPNAVVRWLHNGENISVRNKARKTRI